jgi:hypothetical protein
MAAKVQGRNTAIKFGDEYDGGSGSWGTAVARSKSAVVRSVTLGREVTTEVSPDLRHVATTYNASNTFQASDVARGQVVVTALYEGLGMLLRYALGHAAVSGSGPYTSDYTISAAQEATLVGLTVEVIRGKHSDATAGINELFNGGLINRFELASQSAQEATFTFDFIARTSAARTTAGSVSVGTRYPVLHHHAGSISWNSLTLYANSVRLVVENNLSTEQLLGSLTIDKPIKGDQKVTFEITMSAEKTTSDSLYADYLAGTKADLTLTFTDSVNSKSLAITLHNAYIEAHTDAISATGTVPVTVRWVGTSDGSDHGVKLSLTNAQSSYDG